MMICFLNMAGYTAAWNPMTPIKHSLQGVTWCIIIVEGEDTPWGTDSCGKADGTFRLLPTSEWFELDWLILGCSKI